MTPKTIQQISNAANTDVFALAAYGALLYEGKELPQDTEKARRCLELATEKGVLWAKDLITCIRTINSASNVRQNAKVSEQAIQQLKNYSNQGNSWAKTILAEALYYGYGMPQDRGTGLAELQKAAQLGNHWGSEAYFKIINSTSSYIIRKNESDTWKAFRHTPNTPPNTAAKPEEKSTYNLESLKGYNGPNYPKGGDSPLKF